MNATSGEAPAVCGDLESKIAVAQAAGAGISSCVRDEDAPLCRYPRPELITLEVSAH